MDVSRATPADRDPRVTDAAIVGNPLLMKKLVFAMAIGAALAWAFDPDQGSRRREQVKHRLEEKGVLGSKSGSSSTASNVSTYEPPTTVSA
jgi:hypothetical protein